MKNFRRIPYAFFAGLTLLYASLSPGSILGMGYTAENVNASNQIISNLRDWLSLDLARTPVVWPRHGLFELVFQIPFLLLSRLFFGASPEWADRILSLQPVLVTSLLCTLIFVWVRRVTSSLTWAYVLAMAGAFSTMLWPYAYIGLETTQALFLLLSAYLVFGSKRSGSWRQALLFALSAGLAVSLKSNGIFLVPAVAFLVFVYLRSEPARSEPLERTDWKKSVVIVVTVATLYLLSAYTRTLSPIWSSGTSNVLQSMRADGPLAVLFNFLSLFGSVNKGLIVYSPVTLLCLAALAKTYRIDWRIAIFAALALGGIAVGCSLVYVWSDETWGPRYLHSAIAPLLICFAVSRQAIRFRLRREVPLIALTIWGIAVSFLGAFFYYGNAQFIATRSSQSTIEALQSDPRWNHVRVNLKLLQVWMRDPQSTDADAELWPPAPHWWFEAPTDAPVLKTVNLREFAFPQSSLIRGWPLTKLGSYLVVWYSYLACLVAGSVLLLWVGVLVSREETQIRPRTPERAREPEDQDRRSMSNPV